MHADIAVYEAENLLKTKYYQYTHTGTGQTDVACEEYSIPEDVQSYVDFITPNIHFDKRIATPMKRKEENHNESELNKYHISAIGHKVESGTTNSIGSHEDPTLPKQSDSRFPLGIFNELDNCDTSINPACLRALYYLSESADIDPNSVSKYSYLISSIQSPGRFQCS